MVDSTRETIEKGRKLRNGEDVNDSKKKQDAMFSNNAGSSQEDSASDSDDEDDCHGLCLRYKYLYNHLKEQHENMHEAVISYNPEKEHPEILKKHHHKKNKKNTDADAFDTDQKKNGKKSAARDF